MKACCSEKEVRKHHAGAEAAVRCAEAPNRKRLERGIKLEEELFQRVHTCFQTV